MASNNNRTTYIEEMLKYPRFLLESGGAWPQEKYTTYHKILIFLSVTISILFCIFSIVYIVLNNRDIEGLTTVFSLFVVIGTYTFKLVNIHYNRNLFLTIMKFIKDSEFQPKNSLKYIMDRKISRTKRLQLLFIANTSMIAILFSIGPFFTVWKGDLPLPFPIDVSNSKILHKIVWIYQALVLSWAVWNHPSLELLLCAFMSIGAGQFEMLAEQFAQVADIIPISDTITDENFGIFYENEIIKRLKSLIRLHQKIIRYVKTVDKMYSQVVLIQFLCSIASIAISTFVFITVDTSLTTVYLFFYILGISFEITLICSFGQELLTESVRVAEGCYSSRWNLCGPRVRKLLYIIIERSQRPVLVTGKQLVYPTLATLVTIFKTSYSYCAFIRRMYGTDRN